MAEATNLTGPDLEAGIAMADLPQDTPVLGHAHGKQVVLVRKGSQVCAVGAVCSHYHGPLAEGVVVGDTLRCPWHHARFDLHTGDAVGAPALAPVPCYEIQRHGERVVVGARKPLPQAPRPPSSPQSVVIVGGGAAGEAAAERLRALGCQGSITLVANEAPGPVDRPNLSKDYLAGNAPEEWIPLRSRKFYDKIGVELLLDEDAIRIDPAGRTVSLSGGRSLPYEAALLATGAEPARLPIAGAALPQVFTLRSLADSRRIVAAAGSARRAVIIGSSFIGLEAAASLRARGLEVDVVSRDRLPLERVLGEDLGRYVQRLHEQHGVRFYLTVAPRAITQQGVELDDGRTLSADLVVLGVGVRPRTALAEAAGLLVENGILVDAFLRTSSPGIWAAGDVARFPDARTGKPVRIEHWVVAQRQGQAVARDMLGLGAPFKDVPFFWSQHYDITLAYVGHAESWDAVDVSGSLAANAATVTYRRKGRLLAAVTVGRDQLSLQLEAALESGDEERIEELLRP